MWKWVSLIVACLVVLFMLLWQWLTASTVDTKEISNTFEVVLIQSEGFSTNVYQSDYIRNAYLQTHLIGTLVKETNDGKYAPFLAEIIEVSPDKKEWAFKIREGLYCEDGEPITADSYAAILFKLMREYKKSYGDILGFKKLLGADQLLNPKIKNIPGLKAEGSRLIMKLRSPPERLLGRLTDRYMGYICEGNFAADGITWKDPTRIVSSGSYVIEKFENENSVFIKLRDRFPLNTEVKIDKAHFRSFPELKEEHSPNHGLIQVLDSPQPIEGLTMLSGPPTFAVVASFPVREHQVFRDKKRLQLFFKNLYGISRNDKPNIPGVYYTKGLFPLLDRDFYEVLSIGKEPLVSFTFPPETAAVKISSSISGETRSHILKLLRAAGKPINVKIEEYRNSKNEHNKKLFDIRISSVDLGSKPRFSLLDMVFCSKLGVGFPDPSGTMCRYIQANLDRATGTMESDEIEEVHKIMLDDSSVMPLFHRSYSYQYSRSINVDSVRNIDLWPRLDQIKLTQ